MAVWVFSVVEPRLDQGFLLSVEAAVVASRRWKAEVLLEETVVRPFACSWLSSRLQL